MSIPLHAGTADKNLGRRKLIFWTIMLLLGAAITAYFFYIDDWEETHKPGHKSTDSIQLVVSVFIFYTLLITAVIGGVMYSIVGRFLFRKQSAL